MNRRPVRVALCLIAVALGVARIGMWALGRPMSATALALSVVAVSAGVVGLLATRCAPGRSSE